MLQGRPERLRPPAHLIGPAREVFIEIVTSLDPSHFQPADVHLLCAFAGAVCMERQARDHLEREGPVVDGKPSAWVSVWEKSQRGVVAISLRLRLSPSARVGNRNKVRSEPKLSYYDRARMLEPGGVDNAEGQA
jgi:hypothetical protein